LGHQHLRTRDKRLLETVAQAFIVTADIVGKLRRKRFA
jgi:hypothetical protein